MEGGKLIRIVWLVFGCLLWDPSAMASDPLRKVTANASVREGGKEKWRYFLYFPEDYEEKEDFLFPCLFWLHGRSLRGDDLEQTRRYGPPAMLSKGRDFPFITICPQLPDGAWPADGLQVLLEECLSEYRIDPNRVILMGASLGAMGAWNFAGKLSRLFCRTDSGMRTRAELGGRETD